MKRYNRSIKIAFDKTLGKIVEADKIFDIKTNDFEIRENYNKNNLIFSCSECGQDLTVSNSKYNRMHFKHKPGHSYCVLADEQLTPQEYEQISEILKAKESNRHKELKNKIGEKLKSVKGVDSDSIAIDNKFIINENGKRRPDVYCKFQDKEIVFEIQLSDLPLRYILSRSEFYKEQGIYLIWILDNYDIHNQGRLEKDIKYLTDYHNLFKFDEESETFKLECNYKDLSLKDDNKLMSKWEKKSVSLNDLKYDDTLFQVYYYNYGGNKAEIEKLQNKRAEEINEAQGKRHEKIRVNNANDLADGIIRMIKNYREKKYQYFKEIVHKIEKMDEFETKILNEKLNLKVKIVKGKPPLIKWIDEAIQEDISFLNFILGINKIELDVNKPDDSDRTALQAILLNSNIDNLNTKKIIKQLFKAGYKLTDSDYQFFSQFQVVQKDFEADACIYKLCNNLSDRSLVDDVFNFSCHLLIIESARQGKLIGYDYMGNNIWIQFANNAIQSYSGYWKFFELSFKKFGLWDKLIQLDRNGTFQKKVKIFYSNMPRQKYDFDKVFSNLYPDIESNS